MNVDRYPFRIVVGFLLFSVFLTGFVYAAEPAFRTKFPRRVIKGQQVLVCNRVKTPPKIDGEVDKDPAWQTGNRTRGAWTELGTRSVSGRQTVVYTCFDEKNLYFGFVCEETDLSRVRMDGNLDKADSVEVVLEVGGLMGTGQIHKFRANTRSKPNSWKSAGKFGPNRWMIEMAIPFSSLKKLSNPRRGDIIGIKFARYGKTLKSGEERMISTANTHLPFQYLYLCGYNHLLYFEDSNILRDGDLTTPAKGAFWKITGKADFTKNGMTLANGAILSQTVKLRKQNSYAVEVKQRGKGSFRVLADKRGVALDKKNSGSFWNENKDAVVITIEALSDVTLQNINLRHEPGIEPPGPWCLTNNYVKAERNIRNLLFDAPDGRYRYVKLDYLDRYASDDAPLIRSVRRSYRYDPSLVIEDLGGNKGWISFSKGSLTGRPESAFWRTIGGSAWARHRYVVLEIDLGQEYYVTGMDMHWPAPYILNVEVWGKAEDDEHWILLYMADGELVEPSKRKRYAWGPGDSLGVGFDRTRGLDSTVRHLRWRGTAHTPLYPQLDGIQEFWVWGEPKNDRKGMTAFKPWIDTKKNPPKKASTCTPDRENVQIVPAPRNIRMEKGRFAISRKTKIVFQDEPEARKIATQIQEEIRERWSVELSTVREEDAGADLKRMIYLGQPRLGQAARDWAQKAGLKLNPSPQGYAFKVQPESVIVVGRDAAGLYYGAQSLMQAMRWYQASDPSASGPSVQGMTVVDWPGTLERSTFTSKKNYSALLKMPESEIWRLRRFFHLLSRYKINVMYVPAENIENSWSRGTLAKLCHEIKRDYHVELRPDIFTAEIEGGGWYARLVSGSDAWDSAAFNPDETPRRLSGRSLNMCPLDPKTYQLIFERIDHILEQFGWPSQVWMYDQIYHGLKGARWGVCRRCQKSGKTDRELYQYFLHQLSDHLKRRGARGLLSDKKLSYGSVGRSDSRLDILNLSGNLRIIPSVFAPKSGNTKAVWEYLKQSVPPEFIVDGPEGWPSRERTTSGSGTIQTLFVALYNGGLSRGAHRIWHYPDNPPPLEINRAELSVSLNAWWYRRDFPAWRQGKEPEFYPIDLKPFVNHLSHPTGAETLESGRPPEIDLRYLPTGKQMLGGVEFNIIDPSKNSGKAILMLGRPPTNTHPKVLASISETAGPIPVNRKLASLAFLRTSWYTKNGGMKIGGWWWWLRPTCRVVYDDDLWLVVDAFPYPTDANLMNEWTNGSDIGLYSRVGWSGNSPTSKRVCLGIVEWVNPYPEKTIKHLDFFTPEMRESGGKQAGTGGKRINIYAEVIAAISGVAVVDQDIRFWSTRKHRPPLLPARVPRAANVKELPDLKAKRGSFRYGVSFGSGKLSKRMVDGISYTIEPMKHSMLTGYGVYPAVIVRKGFIPFGVTLRFAKSITLAGVELAGPVHIALQNVIAAPGHRAHKVDVVVEYSVDGKSWEKAGELGGISAEADFLPVALPQTPVKAVRLTGTGAPYREFYQSNSKHGILNHSNESPHFAWRLLAPAKAKGDR